MAISPTQRQTLNGLLGGGPATVGFTRFDPALGTLTGMTLAVTTTVSGTVSVENLDLASVDVAAGLPASLQLKVFDPF